MVMTRQPRHRFAVAGVVGVLVMSACSSSTKTTVATSAPTTAATAVATTAAATTAAAATTPPATGAPTTAAATTVAATAAPTTAAPAKSPILIGALIDSAGASPANTSAPAVVKAWGTYINAKGGINGHPVTIEISETKGDAATSQSELDALVAKKPVLLLVESSSSEAAIAASLGKTGIPILGVGYNPAVWGGDIEAFKLKCSTDAKAPVACALPNAFPITTTFGAVVDEQVLGAKAAGATTLITAACAEVDSCASADPVFTADAKAQGLKAFPATKVSSSAPNYSAQCIQWIQQGVDFIQLSLSGAAGAKIFSDCADQGYKGIFGASAGSVSGELIKTKGLTLAGGINAFPWWVDDAPVVEYREAMKAGGLDDTGIDDPTNTGLWSVLQLFAKANAALVDSPTAADTLGNMYTVKDETLGGLIAPTTFTKGQLAPARPCFWPFILKDGKFTNPLGGLKYQCNPPQA